MLSEHTIKDHGGRRGNGLKHAKTRMTIRDIEAAENLPSRESKGRNRTYGELNDGIYERIRFAILRRFLESTVGKPWVWVYSELRHRFNGSWAELARIVNNQVDRNVVIDAEGIAWEAQYGYRVSGLYVCPLTDIVRRQDRGLGKVISNKLSAERRELEKILERIDIGENEYYELIEGKWYRVRVEHLDPNETIYTDPFTNKKYTRAEKRMPLRKVHRQQCGKRDLRSIRARLAQVRHELAIINTIASV